MNELKTWWQGTSDRERQLVLVCGVVLIIAAIYFMGLKPLAQRAEQAQMQMAGEKQLLSWVQDKANTIVSLRAISSNSSGSNNRPLNQVVSSTARQYKVELIRMQPRDDMLQVWVQPLPFNQLVNWLDNLKDKQGLEVLFLDINRSDKPGMVEVSRLQFKRG